MLEEIRGDLNEMSPISLGHLNTWSSVGSCFEGLGGAALLEKDFGVSKDSHNFRLAFLFSDVQDVSPQLLPACSLLSEVCNRSLQASGNRSPK